MAQSAIAKNHAPHATTGLPPELAMAGRCDVLAGHSHTAFNRDPEIADSIMEIDVNMRNFANARNAIIYPESNRSVRTMLSRRTQVDFGVILLRGRRFKLHVGNHGLEHIARLPWWVVT